MARRERIDEILTTHNRVAEAMGQARVEMRNAHRHIVDAMHAMEAWASAHDAAADAQDIAMNLMLDANRAAIALLHEDQP